LFSHIDKGTAWAKITLGCDGYSSPGYGSGKAFRGLLYYPDFNMFKVAAWVGRYRGETGE